MITRGFVVSSYDALNLDLDLASPEPNLELSGVVCEEYTYIDPPDPEVKRGRTMRCRLRGLAHQSEFRSKMKFRRGGKKPSRWSKDAHLAMIRHFDRCNGWTLVQVHNVDVYNRLIVSLYDPITKQDLREMLLAKFPHAFVACGDQNEPANLPVNVAPKPPKQQPDPDGFICVSRR